MSADNNISSFHQYAQQKIAYKFPGSEVKETVECGPLMLHLFQRGVDGLCGVIIHGKGGQEGELATALEQLVARYGPLTVMMAPSKFEGLVERFLPQPSSSAEQPLHHRTIRYIPMRGEETGRPRPQYVHASVQPRMMGMSMGLMQAASAIPATAQAETESRKGQIQQSLDATISENWESLGLVDCSGQWVKEDGSPGYNGPETDIKDALLPVLASKSVADFDKLMTPYSLYPYRYISRCWINPENGIKNRIEDLPALRAIRQALVEREGLESRLQTESTAQLNQLKLLRERFGSYFGLWSGSRLASDTARAVIQEQHAPWDGALGHLEDLARHMEHDAGYAALRKARLGNQLIANVRLLHFRLAQYRQMRQDTGTLNALWTVGGSIATLEPILACVSLYASLLAMARSSGEERTFPLSQQAFLHVINEGLFPMMEEMHQSLAARQAWLAEQTDEQTTALLQAASQCQQELSQLLARQSRESSRRFDTKEFNDFVKEAQRRVETYRDTLLRAKEFIKGKERYTDGWLQEYLDTTSTALDNGSRPLANGFNGATATYPFACVSQNAMYCTGLIHESALGNHAFPPPTSSP